MSEHLKPIIASMAVAFGYNAQAPFTFPFPEIPATRTTTYNPDCVWFSGEPIRENSVAIFEVDRDPSRKHRVGGAALANVTALKLCKRLYYFAVVPPEKNNIAISCIEILKRYLGEKWALEAVVIASFDPDNIEKHIRSVLTKQS